MAWEQADYLGVVPESQSGDIGEIESWKLIVFFKCVTELLLWVNGLQIHGAI